MDMTNSLPVKLLELPNADKLALSIRAKALVFSDPQSQKLLHDIERIAGSDATALIIGETGSGKELVARHIHEQSGRRGPFVAVNCGAFSETLVEAELFGHEAGAFTGAQQARAGWFESANGGTLFLDEIGDLPLPLQVKLLRLLQEKQVVRLGSRKPISLDVRLIAATNVDLEKAVRAGHFRLDLYYRINVAPINLPPLRQRPGDIMPLVQHFIEVYRRKLGLDTVTVASDAVHALHDYSWPGNIRELENVVHFALIMSQDNIIKSSDLRLPSSHLSPHKPADAEAPDPFTAFERALDNLIRSDFDPLYESVERLLIEKTYDHCRLNQVQSAKRLGVSRNILRTQLKRFGLLEGDFHSPFLAESANP